MSYTYRPRPTITVDPAREERYLAALKRGERFWVPSYAITGKDERGHYLQLEGRREYLSKPKLARRMAEWAADTMRPTFRPYR